MSAQPLQPRGALPPGPGWGEAAQKQIPNPGGDFSVLSPGLAFGVEFYQQQLSKINKEGCACQCSRGRARDWQSRTINYSPAPLPACRLRERPWQHAGEPEGERRPGIMEGRGKPAPGHWGNGGRAAGVSLSLLGVRVCARVCRAGLRVPGLEAGIAERIFHRNGADLLVEGLGRLRTPQLSAGGLHGGV